MVDVVVLITIAFSAFFVALSFGLLVRYRQVSQRVNASNDLGRDLWSALEQRMKKQDERILDLMGRLEVLQSRMSERSSFTRPAPEPKSMQSNAPPFESVGTVDLDQHVIPTEQTSQVTPEVTLDDTELTVIRLLGVQPRSSVEIKGLIGKSREHAARLMKTLFDEKLVSRDSSKKPFVYQLTEYGRKFLPAG